MLFIFILFLQSSLAYAEPRVKPHAHRSFTALESWVQDEALAPCDPVSKSLDPTPVSEPSKAFCSHWNPDFHLNGHQCCGPIRSKKRLPHAQARSQRKPRCQEMTEEQREYLSQLTSNRSLDILELIEKDRGKNGAQAYCTVNNGFLAHGRPIVPTDQNRILLNSPKRCTNFGTDPMALMIEWLGRSVAERYWQKEFSQLKLVLGDVSAPRGGSSYGVTGRRGHASHTNGQDADIGFLNAKPGVITQTHFSRDFQVASNWWFIQQIFQNPYVCVKVIFLDRKHIHALAKALKTDPLWLQLKKLIRHMPGHKNHLHVRIGDQAGTPGCGPMPHPELEYEEDFDSYDEERLAQSQAAGEHNRAKREGEKKPE
ncbi:MAG: penicillin-insensitive murein endopeptidase [Bdellovibrionia bacterium]